MWLRASYAKLDDWYVQEVDFKQACGQAYWSILLVILFSILFWLLVMSALRDLPDMYAQIPRVAGPKADHEGTHIRQITNTHVTSNMYYFKH